MRSIRLTREFIDIEAPAVTRAILSGLLEHGDVVGHDQAGRVVITLAVEPWLFDKLLTFDAATEELKPDTDLEMDDQMMI
jgi:hypothetical protein